MPLPCAGLDSRVQLPQSCDGGQGDSLGVKLQRDWAPTSASSVCRSQGTQTMYRSRGGGGHLKHSTVLLAVGCKGFV